MVPKLSPIPAGSLPVSQTATSRCFDWRREIVSISAELPIEKGYLRGWGLFEAGRHKTLRSASSAASR